MNLYHELADRPGRYRKPVGDFAPRDRRPRARLTDAQAFEIRELHAAGWGGYSKLARRFEVPVWVVRRCVLRHTYRDVGGGFEGAE